MFNQTLTDKSPAKDALRNATQLYGLPPRISVRSLISIPPNGEPPVRQVSNSADSLVLLGEMVEMASGYADQVEDASAHDEPFMVRLAQDQLFYLQKRLAKLDEKLKKLNDLLGSRVRRQSRSKRWASEKAHAIDPGVELPQVTH